MDCINTFLSKLLDHRNRKQPRHQDGGPSLYAPTTGKGTGGERVEREKGGEGKKGREGS